jgi:C_GCAxxG_C_C family probable redox protein
MTEHQDKALATFASGLNCAQAVLTTYCGTLNVDETLAQGIACGFGGGMARMQETCGAVTGAFMVISLYNAPKYAEISEQKKQTYAMIREFSRRFTEIHGTKNCRLLLGCDLNTEEGHEYFKKNNLTSTVCCKCIADSVSLLDEFIGRSSVAKPVSF